MIKQGILTRYANSLEKAEQAGVAQAVEDFSGTVGHVALKSWEAAAEGCAYCLLGWLAKDVYGWRDQSRTVRHGGRSYDQIDIASPDGDVTLDELWRGWDDDNSYGEFPWANDIPWQLMDLLMRWNDDLGLRFGEIAARLKQLAGSETYEQIQEYCLAAGWGL